MDTQQRKIDFKYSPSIIQTCIGLVDDEHKTIIREDGSINYNYEFSSFSMEQFNIPKEENISQYTKVKD